MNYTTHKHKALPFLLFLNAYVENYKKFMKSTFHYYYIIITSSSPPYNSLLNYNLY